MQLITYEGRLAALAGTERVYLAAHLDRPPDRDPAKQFVLRLALYAYQLEHHQLPDEPIRYVPARAHQYVREQLMPANEFLACAHLTDCILATLFPRTDRASRGATARARRARSSAAIPPAAHDKGWPTRAHLLVSPQ
jgi:hypothetical protein